ncbi:hypothetical protein [Mycolicibacterium hippocampi]|uniref:Uncharacterized protein n=1 Tax=Mycolicibacterium hippocampi TaxID=659824 RepID=A0A7I9ZKH3_9MYCO|nr:hypothetical protein [Mycolicibacterium hippocampi]GFH01464.1 hypothetical protein MHIP_19470 [Mycolicibacterium hippocampi]
MCPSTDTGGAEFAAEVLRKLLQRIEEANAQGQGPYLVSHAWTAETKLYLVYTAPPSDRTWGLARDTTESIIDPGPWLNVDEAARYYYLVDFEENQPSSSFRHPSDTDAIWWFGFPRDGLTQHPSDLPEENRYRGAGSPLPPHTKEGATPANPRRYGNQLE